MGVSKDINFWIDLPNETSVVE